MKSVKRPDGAAGDFSGGVVLHKNGGVTGSSGLWNASSCGSAWSSRTDTPIHARPRGRHQLLDVRSRIGETVMHWLVVEDVIPAVKSVLALGAAVDSTNNFGQTPLMEAAELGNVEMCELLLEHGANPGYLSPNDESPLCHAARSHQLGTLKVLLAQFADAEDLQPYFDEVYLGIIFSEDSPVTTVLESRGVASRRFSADE